MLLVPWSDISSQTPIIIVCSVGGAVLLGLLIFVFFCSPRWALRRAKREEMVITAFNQHPQLTEITASNQTHILDVSQTLAVSLAQDHDEVTPHNVDPISLSHSPTVSEAPTIRQQQIQAQSQSLTARITELEALAPRLQDAEAEIQRLTAEIQWLRGQEQSAWALGLTNSSPPSYRDPSMTGSI
ncbi:hypothetical protein C8J56DRAFT_1125191 [Mycena floridula]|nr:hypothetical protein C8J56DRAFT_1125191 [Mycena floridula]